MPVIAIDGPSASGKGTVAIEVARRLGFHYLDSGALYRLVALAALDRGIDLDTAWAVEAIAAALDVRFAGERVLLEGREVTDAIREVSVAAGSSRVAAHKGVRDSLLARQRAFRIPPGLVAEGRDMGSIVFPDAGLKVFLTATVEVRAARRYKQLIDKGISVTLADLLQDLRERDERDRTRPVAPLVQLPDARLLDATSISVDEAVSRIVRWYVQQPPQEG